MAKRKDTLFWLTRDLADGCTYFWWPGTTQPTESGDFWTVLAWTPSLRVVTMRPREFERFWPHLTLKPGQCARVRIRHMASGDKFEWADEWIWEHKNKPRTGE